MATVASSTDVSDKVITEAVSWYTEAKHRMPDAFKDIDPLVLRTAYRLAQDWRRCLTDGDGTIIVCRKPVW